MFSVDGCSWLTVFQRLQQSPCVPAVNIVLSAPCRVVQGCIALMASAASGLHASIWAAALDWLISSCRDVRLFVCGEWKGTMETWPYSKIYKYDNDSNAKMWTACIPIPLSTSRQVNILITLNELQHIQHIKLLFIVMIFGAIKKKLAKSLTFAVAISDMSENKKNTWTEEPGNSSAHHILPVVDALCGWHVFPVRQKNH